MKEYILIDYLHPTVKVTLFKTIYECHCGIFKIIDEWNKTNGEQFRIEPNDVDKINSHFIIYHGEECKLKQ
jgi:hypothetical protein